jgi:hypothetical protein
MRKIIIEDDNNLLAYVKGPWCRLVRAFYIVIISIILLKFIYIFSKNMHYLQTLYVLWDFPWKALCFAI